jgi:hypothetical protein
MATPAYRGGGYRRNRGYRRWVHAPAPANLGWIERLGAWFDGDTPRYAGAGQPAPGAVPSGSLVYVPGPQTTTTGDAATTAPQTVPSVTVVPRT